LALSVVTLLAVTLLGNNQPRPSEAASLYPVCAGDLRHLSWVWHFPVDGSKEAIAQKLASSGMGVIVKTHDGTDWMSRYDHSADAVSGPGQVRRLADFFEARGVPFFTYAVLHGVDPITEAHMAAQVLNSGARGIFLDLEPWSGYWRGTAQNALIFGQELRRLAPGGIVITTVEPRPWVLPNIPVAEFATFSDAFATMAYWESFKSNGPHFAAAGYPPGPQGITPEFLIDVGSALLDRYNLPILPIGQGASQDLDAWSRFIAYGAERGMPVVSTWRHGVTYPPVFDILRDRASAGWQAMCGPAPAGPFLGGDFDGDGRDDLVHLTRRDFVRPWLANQNASYNVGFIRPGPGYWVQSGDWLTGKFNFGDFRDDLIHITEGDYANVWIADRSGSFSLKVFRPWPGYGMQSGNWQTADLNGDGLTDLVHLTNGDYVHTWIAKADGSFTVRSFHPGAGYWIQGGSWKTGDFNGDGREDLIHLTPGDYARPWFSRGDGTFDVGYFSAGPGYGMQWGSWETGDFNADGFDDLVHLTGGDYVRQWFGQPNGAFAVGFFSPGVGYGIQWGSWKAGDFNGDGRTDLVHLTGGDYVRPWISQPNGAFTVGYFQPGPGYWIQGGTWHVGDVNGDGRKDLVHAPGADYIRPWIARSDGTFNVKFFQPWPGYRM
jgi:hypothetical protein